MPYQSITLGQFVTLLQGRMQNSAFWSGVEYRQIINESLSLLQICTLYFKSRFVSQTVAGLVFYDLTSMPGTLDLNGNPLILMPLRVAFNGAPLDFSAISDTDSAILGWQIQQTTTPGAPTTPQFWGTLGLGYLYLWPADAVGGNSLLIDAAVRAPAYATNGSDDGKYVNIDSGMVTGILDYCQHVCQQKRGTQQLQSTMAKLKAFMRLLGKQNSLFEASAIFKASYALQQDRKNRTASDFSGKPTVARYR